MKTEKFLKIKKILIKMKKYLNIQNQPHLENLDVMIY